MRTRASPSLRASKLTVSHHSSCVPSLYAYTRPTEMAPYYRIVTSTSALPLDQSLLERMEKENKDELDKIEERLEEAKKTEGETDIADALRARANYLTRIGDKVH